MNEENRVGYTTVGILADLLKTYINLHTEDGRYIGKLRYLEIAKQHEDYLRN